MSRKNYDVGTIFHSLRCLIDFERLSLKIYCFLKMHLHYFVDLLYLNLLFTLTFLYSQLYVYFSKFLTEPALITGTRKHFLPRNPPPLTKKCHVYVCYLYVQRPR